MTKEEGKYHVIGVMSGTSLDGIDLAEVVFTNDPQNRGAEWNFEILSAETIPYSSYWKQDLREAITYSQEQLDRLDFKYTAKLAEEILGFMQRNNIQVVDAICSHGHTIFHQPEKGFTLQIGNLPRLAKLVEQKVVNDFRVQDVQLGGQGAPLVPIGDSLLFSEYDFCLNLGGFANISTEMNGERIAFDVCPANIVLNKLSEKLGKEYDENGDFARSGTVDEKLLKNLNSLSFYYQEPPKSLGLEWVKTNIDPLIQEMAISTEDILCTFTEHIATQISQRVNKGSTVLLTGGGARNNFLIERLKMLSYAQLEIPDFKIVDYKEALIFGLLGVLKLRGDVNCLASVTGASHDHSSGHIHTP